MNKVWQVSRKSTESQGWFGFDMINAAANAVTGDKVNQLKRFNADGKLHEVTYASWLRFHAPLNSRGVMVRETEAATVFSPSWN